MRTSEWTVGLAVVAIEMALLACKPRAGTETDGGPSAPPPSIAPSLAESDAGGPTPSLPSLTGDVCRIATMNACIEFDGTDPVKHRGACEKLSGTYDASDRCPAEGRVGTCRVAAGAMLTAPYAMNVEYCAPADPVDGAETCEHGLFRGSFVAAARSELTTGWTRVPLSGQLAGFSVLAPPGTKVTKLGSTTFIEDGAHRCHLVIAKGATSQSDRVSKASSDEEGKFDSFIEDTPSTTSWKSRLSGGATIYEFIAQVTVSGTTVTCSSFGFFSTLDAMNANLEACRSLAMK